jgi:hypothetical protein
MVRWLLCWWKFVKFSREHIAEPCWFLPSCWLPALLSFDIEEGDSMFFWNITKLLPDNMVSHPRRQYTSQSLHWEPEVQQNKYMYVKVKVKFSYAKLRTMPWRHVEWRYSSPSLNLATSFSWVMIFEHLRLYCQYSCCWVGPSTNLGDVESENSLACAGTERWFLSYLVCSPVTVLTELTQLQFMYNKSCLS